MNSNSSNNNKIDPALAAMQAQINDVNKKFKSMINAFIAEFRCPILQSLPTTPVIAADGFIYDETAIKQWFIRLGTRAISPVQGIIMPNRDLHRCPKLENLLAIVKDYGAENTTASPSADDVNLAITLHLEELTARANKQGTLTQDLQSTIARMANASAMSQQDLQTRIQYYEQVLRANESELKNLRGNAGNAVVATTSLNFGDQFQLSLDAIVQLLNANPNLITLTTSIYAIQKIFKGTHDWCDILTVLPNNQIIAGSQYPVIKEFNPITLTLRREYRGHVIPTTNSFMPSREGQVYDFAVAPSQPWFASASGDKTVIIWNYLTGAKVFTLSGQHTENVCAVCFLNANTIASGGRDKRILIWQIQENTPPSLMQTFIGHVGDIYRIVFLQSQQLLVSCSGTQTDGEIKVWDLKSGVCIKNLSGPKITDGHTALIYTMIKTIDEKRVITGADDHTIRIWDTTNWTSQELKGHQHYVNVLAMIRPDVLASGSEDHTIKLWNIHTGICLATINVGSKTWALCALPTGNLLAADTSGIFRVLAKTTYDLRFRYWVNDQCTITRPTTDLILLQLQTAMTSSSWELLDQLVQFINTLIGTTAVEPECIYTTVKLKFQNNADADSAQKLLIACKATTFSQSATMTTALHDDANKAAAQQQSESLAISVAEKVLQEDDDDYEDVAMQKFI